MCRSSLFPKISIDRFENLSISSWSNIPNLRSLQLTISITTLAGVDYDSPGYDSLASGQAVRSFGSLLGCCK